MHNENDYDEENQNEEYQNNSLGSRTEEQENSRLQKGVTESLKGRGGEVTSSSKNVGGAKGLFNKGKKGAKDGAKKAAKVFLDGAKKLWHAIPIKVRMIILVIVLLIVFVAVVVLILDEEPVTTSIAASKSYYMSQDPTTISQGRALYLSTGSYLLSTKDEIAEIAKEYYKTPTIAEDLMSEFKRKYKDGDKDNSNVKLVSGARAVKENEELYQHILNTEKYNFNRIVWREFDRDKIKGTLDDPTQPTMKLDNDSGLQYPKDKLGTTLQGFTSMVRPYLQTWVIPYTMYSGLYHTGNLGNDKKTTQYAYEIIANAYHKITIDKYNMENLTTVSKQNIYDETTMEVAVKVTCVDITETIDRPRNDSTLINLIDIRDKAQEETENAKKYYDNMVKACQESPGAGCAEYIQNLKNEHIRLKSISDQASRNVSELSPTIQVTRQECTEEILPEKATKEEFCLEGAITNTEFKATEERYYTKHIDTFDSTINYEYEYIPYDRNAEPAEMGVNREKYKEEPATKPKPVIKKDGSGKTIPGTYTANYIIKEGYTETITKVYKDNITQESYEKRPYKTSDIEDFIAPDTLRSDVKSYYNVAEEASALNRHDFINANKDMYSKYIKSGQEFTKNIGYHRSYTSFGLNLLAKTMIGIQSEYKNSFAYGASLGLKEATETSLPGIDSFDVHSVDYSTLPEGGFGWPAPGNSTISSPFGPRTRGFHDGIDIRLNRGSSVVAIADGEVIKVQSGYADHGSYSSLAEIPDNIWKQGYGNHIKIRHLNRI